MPWRCPACETEIRQSPLQEHLQRGVVYRCSVCRLELMLDHDLDKLIVPPLPEHHQVYRKGRGTI